MHRWLMTWTVVCSWRHGCIKLTSGTLATITRMKPFTNAFSAWLGVRPKPITNNVIPQQKARMATNFTRRCTSICRVLLVCTVSVARDAILPMKVLSPKATTQQHQYVRLTPCTNCAGMSTRYQTVSRHALAEGNANTACTPLLASLPSVYYNSMYR